MPPRSPRSSSSPKKDVAVVRRENGGLSPARMTGVEATAAPYVFPLDADDMLVPGALAALADALDATPAAALALGRRRDLGRARARARGRAIARPVAAHVPERRSGRLDPPPQPRSKRSAAGAWAPATKTGTSGWPSPSVATPASTSAGRRCATAAAPGGCSTIAHPEHGALYAKLRSRHPALFAARGSQSPPARRPRCGRSSRLPAPRRASPRSASRVTAPYLFLNRPRQAVSFRRLRRAATTAR